MCIHLCGDLQYYASAEFFPDRKEVQSAQAAANLGVSMVKQPNSQSGSAVR
jgi:hypothetical protein